ncbi:MAG: hypothetical protein V2A78_10300 [bacterium]
MEGKKASTCESSHVKTNFGRAREFKLKLRACLKEKAGEEKALWKACQQMESFFLSSLFQEMNVRSQFGGSFWGDNPGEKLFSSLLNDEWGNLAADSGGIGIARLLFQDLFRHQSIKKGGTHEDRSQ